MKNTLLILFVAIWFQFSNAQVEAESIWKEDYSEVQKIAKNENKKILVFFTGSDWCTYCKALEADVFETEKFNEFTKNTVLYKADFPRAKDIVSKKQQKDNLQLKKKYNKEESYPVIVILDKNGKLVAKKKSYNLMRDASYHFTFLKENLN